MAKLYAELTSDKGGRVASKGGDKQITFNVTYKNVKVMTVTVLDIGQTAPHITVNDWRK